MRDSSWCSVVLTISVCLLLAAVGAAAAEGPDETAREQAAALAAEQSPAAVEQVTVLSAPSAVTHPLFVGVDDTTVPAYQIDPATADAITAFVGVQVWGSAYDPDGDRVYFNNGSVLYEWPVGGTVTELGTMTDLAGLVQTMVGLAFHDGTLYGIKNIANEAVYIIDPATLEVTVHIEYEDGDLDLGGLAADPTTGELYATNDDATPLGSGLFRINGDGTAAKIADYPEGQTDIDGLAISDARVAYLVIDEPGLIYPYDLVAGAYLTPFANPWTTAEVFSAGAWISGTTAPSISLTKTVGTAPGVCAPTSAIAVPEGTTVYYCYTVTNTGDVALGLHDLVDDQLGTIFTGLNYLLGPGESVDTVAAGLSIPAVITATTTNTATWTAYNVGAADQATAEASATVTVVRNPAISVTKTVGTAPGVCAATSAISVTEGTTVYYCYTVTNTGDVTLNLHDLADDRLGAIFSGFAYALAPGASVDTVAAGLSIPAVITATTTNTATWTAYNAGPTDQATAQASATVTVLEPAYVSGTKTVSGSFVPLSTVTYTIVLTNAGPGPQPDLPGDELVDTLPPELTATGVTASSGTAALAGNTVRWNGSIAAGGSVTLTITATIGDVPGGTEVVNQGTVAYDDTGEGSNGATRPTDDPGLPGVDDPTRFVVVVFEPIPTLHGSGVVILTLLLAVVGVLALRRLS